MTEIEHKVIPVTYLWSTKKSKHVPSVAGLTSIVICVWAMGKNFAFSKACKKNCPPPGNGGFQPDILTMCGIRFKHNLWTENIFPTNMNNFSFTLRLILYTWVHMTVDIKDALYVYDMTRWLVIVPDAWPDISLPTGNVTSHVEFVALLATRALAPITVNTGNQTLKLTLGGDSRK